MAKTKEDVTDEKEKNINAIAVTAVGDVVVEGELLHSIRHK